MGKLVLYIAASLDGFIAGDGESLAWLDAVEGQGDNGYGSFYEGVDTLVMGRKTYDWIVRHGSWPYPGKPCVVFSRTPRKNGEDVTFTAENAGQAVGRMKAEGEKRIWLVGGGELLHILLKAGLVDEIILTVAPVVLGRGVPLFRGAEGNLRLVEIQRFGQFAQLHYFVEGREEAL